MTAAAQAQSLRSRAWAEVSIAALAHNLAAVRGRTGPGRAIVAAVKCNGYGHGAVQVSRTFLDAGADMLAVASVEEGAELRAAGIAAPTIVLGATLPEQAAQVIEQGLSPVVCNEESARALSHAAAGGASAKVHVKVDTGMGRIGVPCDEAVEFVQRVARLPHVEIEGICTHFPVADAEDKTFTLGQVERFAAVVDALEAGGIHASMKHAANSPAIRGVPESYFTAVRPGLMLYGAYGSPRASRTADLQQALTLKARVTFLKRVPAGTPLCYGLTYTTPRASRIATVPLGYGDGFDRRFSNCGHVLLRGQRAAIVGRVCMDQCLVDVTDVPGVELGDEVVAYGRQGEECISLDDAAESIGTIPHVLMCALSRRIPRLYV